MTYKKISFLGAIVLMIAGVSLYVGQTLLVSANPTFPGRPCFIDGLTSATSTVKWMTPGQATSTIGLSTLCDVTTTDNTLPTALNLVLQQAASSTALSTLDINVETSFDGQLWAVEPYHTFTSVTATTTVDVYTPKFLRRFNQTASSTEVISGNSSATSTIVFQIPNPNRARFVKVFFSVPAGATNSNVWAVLVPVKEMR